MEKWELWPYSCGADRAKSFLEAEIDVPATAELSENVFDACTKIMYEENSELVQWNILSSEDVLYIFCEVD